MGRPFSLYGLSLTLCIALSFILSSCTPVFQNLPCENCNETIVHTIQVHEGQTIDLVKELGLSSQKKYLFSKPISSAGIWKTEVSDAGEYTVYVESVDPVLAGRQLVHIVVKPLNYPPTIFLANQTAYEGTLFTLNYTISDPEQDPLSISFPGFMKTNITSFSYTSSGEYVVVIRVSDGKNIVYANATLTVIDVNTPPNITHPHFLTAKVGEVVQLTPSVFDEQNDSISLTYQRPFNASGAFIATQQMVGNHTTRIRASDGVTRSTLFVNYSIISTNVAPVLKVSNITLFETELVNISYTVFDADNDTVDVTFRGFTSTPFINTTYGDAGNYTVTIQATDGIHTVSQLVWIVILKTHRPPVWIGIR
jgi:hypothetical protein